MHGFLRTQSKRVRYVGLVKNHFTTLMQAPAFNRKRLSVLDPPPTVPSCSLPNKWNLSKKQAKWRC